MNILVTTYAAVLVCVLALANRAGAAEVYRFLDHSAAPVTTMDIGAMFKRVLNPRGGAEIFEVPQAEATSILSFAIGMQETASGGTVRFEIESEQEGKWLPIYSKDLSTPTWIDEHVMVPAGARRLRLRRTLLAGTREQLAKSAFGDPVLLPEDMRKRPSVILISIDTLRADHLGLAGYKNARTPVLDAFGKSGVWYTQAYSPSAWTLPSHASLLYGRSLPAPLARRPSTGTPAISPSDPLSLAEVLRAEGYLTAGFTGGGWVSPAFAFDRGFDTYFSFLPKKTDSLNCAPERFDGPEVFRRGIDWLRERGRAPFFLFLHTYDVHDRCPFQPILEPKIAWHSLTDMGKLITYYDDLIAGIDARVGTLLKEIDSLGLRETTLIVITSDHGELFKEHNQQTHGCGNTLWEELIRVPLLMRYPARIKPRAPDDQPVGLTDVAPTILHLLDLSPPASMSGSPLPGFITPDAGPRPVLIVCDNEVAVRLGALKLISSRTRANAHMLFDLERDPGEKVDVYSTRKDEAAPLLRLTKEYWIGPPGTPTPQPQREIDETTKQRLRALGYDP